MVRSNADMSSIAYEWIVWKTQKINNHPTLSLSLSYTHWKLVCGVVGMKLERIYAQIYILCWLAEEARAKKAARGPTISNTNNNSNGIGSSIELWFDASQCTHKVTTKRSNFVVIVLLTYLFCLLATQNMYLFIWYRIIAIGAMYSWAVREVDRHQKQRADWPFTKQTTTEKKTRKATMQCVTNACINKFHEIACVRRYTYPKKNARPVTTAPLFPSSLHCLHFSCQFYTAVHL